MNWTEIEVGAIYKHRVAIENDAWKNAIVLELGKSVPEDFDWRSRSLVDNLRRIDCKHDYYWNNWTKMPRMREIVAIRDRFGVAKYKFDVTDKLDWNAGDFKDNHSCFWKSSQYNRIALQDGGCLALRFYDKDGGAGRAWMWPWKKQYPIIFNAYGMPIDLMAAVLADFMGYSFKRVSLESKSNIYVNGPGGRLIAPVEILKSCTDMIVLPFKIYADCFNCKKRLAIEEIVLGDTDNTSRDYLRGLCLACQRIPLCIHCGDKGVFEKGRDSTGYYSEYLVCKKCKYECRACYFCGDRRLKHYIRKGNNIYRVCQECYYKR